MIYFQPSGSIYPGMNSGSVVSLRLWWALVGARAEVGREALVGLGAERSLVAKVSWEALVCVGVEVGVRAEVVVKAEMGVRAETGGGRTIAPLHNAHHKTNTKKKGHEDADTDEEFSSTSPSA